MWKGVKNMPQPEVCSRSSESTILMHVKEQRFSSSELNQGAVANVFEAVSATRFLEIGFGKILAIQ